LLYLQIDPACSRAFPLEEAVGLERGVAHGRARRHPHRLRVHGVPPATTTIATTTIAATAAAAAAGAAGAAGADVGPRLPAARVPVLVLLGLVRRRLRPRLLCQVSSRRPAPAFALAVTSTTEGRLDEGSHEGSRNHLTVSVEDLGCFLS
jgi:hypothetical protein